MEASGLGGPMMGLVLLPGLLSAGIGSLIFTGLDSWTGLGTFSLAIPGLPHAGQPTLAEFGWAVAIGVAAAPVGAGIRWLGRWLHRYAHRWPLLVTPAAGLAVAGLAIAYAEGAGKGTSDVLFSGQDALGPLITHGASYTVAALLLLIACKGLAYGISLSSFRGGPVFPAIFIGAAGGMALSHLPGLSLTDGVAIGMGAMTVVMLTLPLTSVLLAALLVGSSGLAVDAARDRRGRRGLRHGGAAGPGARARRPGAGCSPGRAAARRPHIARGAWRDPSVTASLFAAHGGQMIRSASAGASRAARSAGYSPASMPTARAMATAASRTGTGTTARQCRAVA